MRFAITALGSAGGRSVGQVVGDIVRYLEPRTPEQPAQAPVVPSGEGPSSYYADRGTEAGRWLGHAAREAALAVARFVVRRTCKCVSVGSGRRDRRDDGVNVSGAPAGATVCPTSGAKT